MSQANTAALTAVLNFVRGPEKGKQFEVRDGLVHLGRGAESQFRLHAKDLQDYELSIVLRNNRFAIYSSREETVSVEGNLLPAEKWVWLPEQALVKVGKQTEFEFEVQQTARVKGPAAKTSSRSPAAGEEERGNRSGSNARPPAKSRGQKSAGETTGRKSGSQPVRKSAVAKFITDKVGDPLVQLGEDGHLPELHLSETETGSKRKKSDATAGKKSEGSPLLVGIALAFSVVSSTLLLVLDFGPGGADKIDKSTARLQIESFYGAEGDELEDYQLLLREAAHAHAHQDYKREKIYYRKVLNMLISEDNQGLIRLTENRDRDKELRDLLSVLLAQ